MAARLRVDEETVARNSSANPEPKVGKLRSPFLKSRDGREAKRSEHH